MPKPARRLLQLAALVLVVACFAFVARHIDALALADRLDRLTPADAGPLVGALLLFTAGLVCVGASWVLLLRGFAAARPPDSPSVGASDGPSDGPSRGPSSARLLAICLTWQLAKYLPANLFHFIGRTGEACRAGIGLRAAVAANLAEIGLLAGLGVILAAVCLGLSGTTLPLAGLPVFTGAAPPAVTPDLALAVGGLSGLLLCLALAWRWQRARAAAVDSLADRRFLGAGLLVFLFFPAFAVAGLIAAPLDTAGAGTTEPQALLAVGGVLIAAWVAGFVIPGAPGGLGVREAVILAALTPTLGSADASWLAFVQRALAVGADLACFLIGLGLRLSAPTHTPTHTPR